MFKVLMAISATLLLVACSQEEAPSVSQEEMSSSMEKVEAVAELPETNRLSEILAAQPEKVQARYVYRHPQETLEFIGIEPGMTVVEALPGGGWYSKILLPYLGSKGKLIGADYSLDMFPLFGFFSEERLEAKKTWTTDWVADANGWGEEYKDSAEAGAFVFGSMPDSYVGSADAVLFIRALHNLSRFEDQGGFLTAALDNTYRVLKPGGIVGVVQHEARSDMSDAWSTGSNGYLKKDALIARMEAVGFEYVDSSDINQNPGDQPTEEDIVWRLPPNFATSGDNPELKAKMTAIGESNRMTLKFRKPE